MKPLHEVRATPPEHLMRIARAILDVDRNYRFRVRNNALQYSVYGNPWTECNDRVALDYGRRHPSTTIDFALTRFDP